VKLIYIITIQLANDLNIINHIESN